MASVTAVVVVVVVVSAEEEVTASVIEAPLGVVEVATPTEVIMGM